jgi:gamma-glutamylcyclotransferase (GGCT)/AIG2-like uncharacterized protein YtfP
MVMTTRLFVYGSLRRGEPNHRQLAAARCVGAARTAPFFTLFDLGPFPALAEGGDTSVHGELYDADDVTLAALDRFEGVPRFYQRQAIVLDDGSVAHTYVQPRERLRGEPLVASGDWPTHRRAKQRPRVACSRRNDGSRPEEQRRDRHPPHGRWMTT